MAEELKSHQEQQLIKSENLKNTKIMNGYPGFEESRTGGYEPGEEHMFTELLAKVREFALKVENSLQLSPGQEIVWDTSFVAPMSKEEEQRKLKEIDFDISFTIKESANYLHKVTLSEKDIEELEEMRKEVMTNYSKREELRSKFAEKVLPLTFSGRNFRRACSNLRVSVMSGDEVISYFDNILMEQGEDAVHYKYGSPSKNVDEAAQFIVKELREQAK